MRNWNARCGVKLLLFAVFISIYLRVLLLDLFKMAPQHYGYNLYARRDEDMAPIISLRCTSYSQMMRNIFHPPPRLYAEAVGTNPPYGYKIKFIAFRGRPFIRAPTDSLLPVGGTNTLIFFFLFFSCEYLMLWKELLLFFRRAGGQPSPLAGTEKWRERFEFFRIKGGGVRRFSRSWNRLNRHSLLELETEYFFLSAGLWCKLFSTS